ncbi:MAG: transaldolase family protein [Chloroflexota bacterium]|nr:transaldolase family protein [Chloroflexota bacterium]
MSAHYFERVHEATGSRFWVNNPTLEEMDLALEHGAMGCTTNPGYGGNLVKRAPDEVLPIVRECLPESDDDEVVADLVQRKLVGRICERFLPLYERSGGREGFVSIQGAPELDTVGANILEAGHVARTIAPNATPKIPATAPGFEALEALVAEGSQVIVTEVFSVAQVIETCERWLAVTKRTGVRPPFFMSPITGILGDHLKKLAARDGLDVPVEAMEMAGVILSRACYDVVREREYPVTLLYGGARIELDFSGLVGGSMAATINWSTAAELIVADLPAAVTVTDPLDPAITQVLLDAFPEMGQALDPNGLPTEDYEEFGPVLHFRDMFIAGWDSVREMIRTARADGVM